MSSNSRRSRRRSLSVQRTRQTSWLRRYLRGLRTGVAAASIGALGLLAEPATGAEAIWIGNTSNLWTVPANWSVLPATGDTLRFGIAGTAGTTLSDDLMTPAAFNIAGITYDARAAGFTINPATAGTNGFTLTGGITNNSTAIQTINDAIVTTAVRTVNSTAGGTVVLGGGISGTGGGILKTGDGALTLSGTNTFTGGITINSGTVNVNGAVGTLNNPVPLPTPPARLASVPSGTLLIGNLTGSRAIVNVTSGNLTVNNMHVGGVIANYTAANAGANGAIYQSGGTINTTNGASTAVFQLGAGVGGYGYYRMSGGTHISNEVGIGGAALGANNANSVGVLDISGGTFFENGWVTMVRGTGGGQIGVINMTGGELRAGTDLGIGGRMAMGGGSTIPWTAVVNVTNASVIGAPTTTYEMRLSDGGGAGSLGVVNLNANGLMEIGRVNSATAGITTFFNFNGGTLRASTNNTNNYMSSANMTGVNVFGGGATVDNNGFSINISNPFLAPTGSGVSSIAVTDGGTGYIGAPAVTLTGGTGMGATAVANFNPATGVVTGITVTGPGTGYTPGDVLTATLTGGGSLTPATVGAITLAPNVSGGMTFTGSGTTILQTGGAVQQSGQSTYTGATAINNGTLLMTGSASLNGTTGITIGTASQPARLVSTSSTPVSVPVTLTRGTIDGNGTVNTVVVASNAANTIGNGSNGTLSTALPMTFGTLTFNGAATLTPVTSVSAATTTAISVTNLTASGGAASISVKPINTSGGWSAGLYQIVNYTGAIAGTGFSAFNLDTASMGLGVRQSASLTNPAGLINLVVAGNAALWTGTGDGTWTTAVQPTKNWVLSSALTPTDYVSGDAVVFDDTAAGTTTVNISTADVTPALTSFDHSVQNYTISSAGGFKIAGVGGLIKSGTGSLTLNTANTYSGGTIVNGGTLNFGNASAIGTGPLTLALNTTIDNTSGAALTLSTNNAQTWNGDQTFTGTNNLNLGTGTITVNANAGNVTANRTTINTVANTLTHGGTINLPGGLNKTGLGKLELNAGTIPGQSTVVRGTLVKSGTGTLNFSNGTAPSLSIGFAAGASSSVIVNSGTLSTTSELWLGSSENSYGAMTVNGGAVNTGSWLALARQSGVPNPNTGIGIVNLNGGTITTASNRITIGSFGNPTGRALINVSGGTLATSGTAGVFVGENLPGFLNVWGNGTTQGQVDIPNSSNLGMQIAVAANAGISVVNLGRLGGGTTNNGRITTEDVNGGGGTEIFNWHGGTLRSNADANGGDFMENLAQAYIWSEGAVFDSQGNNNVIDQVLSAPAGMGVAVNPDGTVTGLTVSGTGFIDTPFVEVSGGGGTGATARATINYNTGALTGIILTNPGTNYSSAPTFTLVGGGESSSGTIGGTASLAANSSGGFTKLGTGTVTLAQNNTYTGGTTLSAGTMNINSARALGTGTFTIAGGTTINNSTGAAITLANNNAQVWNGDFTFTGTRTLNLGTGAVSLGTTAGTARTLTVNAANAGQFLSIGGVISNGTTATGITKAGAGTLVLTGTNAYTGATSVTAGVLSLSGTGAINTSSGVTVNGATARLLTTSSVAVSPTVTQTLGTIDGTGTFNNVSVANAAGNVITHGNGTLTPLTINNLTFAGAATLNLLTSATTAATPKINTTTLTTGASGDVAVNASNASGFWEPGSFALVSHTGAIGGGGFARFTVGAFTGLGGRQTAALTNPAGLINVTIGGDRAVWTGLAGGNWDATVQGAPKNWKLSSAGTATDFVANDAVVFDDTATGATTVNITANVNPANTLFNNSTKNYTLQSAGGFAITNGTVSPGTIIKNGSGSLTINNANTYTGGTFLNAGTLNINNPGTANPAASAIGTGPLTIAGGTIDNTSGGAIAVATNNLQNWNGDFTFGSSNALDLGNGAVTLGGSGTSRTVTVGNSQLGVGPISGPLGLTKAGPGLLTINSAPAASNITGELNVAAGILQIATGTDGNNFNSGGLTGPGTIENNSDDNLTVVTTQNTDSTFSGVLSDGFAGGRIGLSKQGSGTLTLPSSYTYSNGTTVGGGKVVLTGSINPAVAGGFGQVNVGTTDTGISAVLEVQATTLTAPKNTAPSVQVGGSVAGTAGALKVTAGSTITTGSDIWLANSEGAYGAMDMLGGTVTSASWFVVGRSGGVGVLNMSAGDLNVGTNQMSIGSLGAVAAAGTPRGVVNLSGGTISLANNVYAGEQNNGVLNVSGTGVLNVGIAVRLALTGTAPVGIVNLLGGTINTPFVAQGAGTGIFNFNGGTLRPSVDAPAFMTAAGNTGTLSVYSHAGGAKIDTNGLSAQIDAPIQAPPGNGVSATGLTVSGGGYISTPVVSITGGGGTGATANAVIDASGNLTGINITNPGVNYTSAPTFGLIGGGIGNTGALGGAATLAPNVSGGLNKLGVGFLTLGGVNTYTGPTRVTEGTLTMGVANAINTNSRLELAGGTFATGGLSTEFGQLQVLANSVLDLGFGASVLNFDISNALAWTGNLSISNWESANGDQIFIGAAAGGLTNTQLNRIVFAGSGQPAAILLATGELRPGTPGAGMLLGDVTRNNHVDVLDITAMMAALSNMPAYRAANPTLTDGNIIEIFDLSGSGTANNADVQSLITYLKNGNGSTAPVPEPGTLVLMVLAAIPGVFMARKLRNDKKLPEGEEIA